MPSYRSYILCTTSRSGSTLLCGLLAQTGLLGDPDSYFHLPSVSRWAEDTGLDASAFPTPHALLDAVMAAMIEAGSAGTPVFGLRLMRKSFGYLMEQLDVLHPGLPNDRARLTAAFGETLYVYLTRADKVAQAVSLIKASQTGLWHIAPDGTEVERTAPPEPARYDRDLIAETVAELAAFDAEWLRWFDAQGIAPLTIRYDELAEAPQDAVGRILQRFGLDRSAAARVMPPVARLADETSRIWIDRFRAETPSIRGGT